MTERTLNALPETISAGDSVSFVQSCPDCPAGDGWKLTYSLLAKGQDPVRIESTASGEDHAFGVAPADSAKWIPGLYHWTLTASKGETERRSLGNGMIRIIVDPLAADSTYDPRPWAMRALEAVEAALEGSLEDAIRSFEIRGTKIEALTPDALRRERIRLLQEVRLLKGKPLVGMLGVRLQ